MTFKVMKTSNVSKETTTKVLLYAHHGFGKTFQCRFYQKRFGPGLILSGEAGLKSIEDVDIDYLPFSSWDRENDPDKGVYSFRGICKMIASPEFQKAGYKWIGLDSLTELSERLIEHLEDEYKNVNNGFAMWGEYNRLMLGTLKWIRDLPLHVYVTCLAKEEKDANDVTQFWPLVKGSGVSKHVPAIFDHVMCGVRTTEKNDQGLPKVKRYIVTDEVSGWHGKVRDPRHRVRPFEQCDDITQLLDRMTMNEEEYDKFVNSRKGAKDE
jgi:hypothetical protein